MEPPPWLPMGLALEECEAKALAQSKQHCVAERRRRERINGHLEALRTLLPGTAQSDKASLLGAAVKTLRELEDEASRLVADGVLMPSDVDELDVQEVSYEAAFARERATQAAAEQASSEGTPRKRLKVEKGEGEAEASSEGPADVAGPSPERRERRRSQGEADVSASQDSTSAGGGQERQGEKGKQGGGVSLVRVRVSAEDKFDLLPSFKKTVQLLRMELVKMDSSSCWNRVTHEMFLAWTEQPTPLQRTEGQEDPSSSADGKGSKGQENSPSLEVIHAAFKASIERLKSKASDGSAK